MEAKSALAEFGLSDKEIAVYLACIKTGVSSVVRIAELTNLPKSTCYDILRALIAKGLCTSVIKEKVQYFEAVGPEILLTKLKEKETKLKAVLPALKSMRATAATKPSVELYLGKEGVKSIYDDVLKTKKEFLVLGNHLRFADFFKWFSNQFILRRVKAKIPCRYIAEQSELSRAVKKHDKDELRQTRINAIMNTQKAECYIFGDKVAFVVLSKNEPIGVLIENKDIANLQRVLFEHVWKS